MGLSPAGPAFRGPGRTRTVPENTVIVKITKLTKGCTCAYTEHQLADIAFGDTVSFLHKPFRAIDLTGAVRRTLVKSATPAEGTAV